MNQQRGWRADISSKKYILNNSIDMEFTYSGTSV